MNNGTTDASFAGTVVPAGFAATIAGAFDRAPGYNGELVPPANARLDRPEALAIDADANLFFTEPTAERLRRFSLR